MFLNCEVWRQYAENVTESLQKGMKVIVTGRLKSRSYETNSGEKRTVFEVEVDEVGPALRNATAKVTKVASSGGQGGGNWQGSGSGSGNRSSSNEGGGGWGGQSSQAAPRQPENDPWASAQSDEPPF
jgi:single-strand DNA-binding protein